MSKPQDGFISRFVNRPISSRITRLLAKIPIHPNAFTMLIFVLPLIAAVFLQYGDYVSVVIGAAIFQVFSVLDGCDGEIARAKNLESKFGERLDSICDFLGSLIYVVALGTGLDHFKEGVVCAVLITVNELLLRWGTGAKRVASEDFHESFYARHHGMIGHSGLLDLGERFVWWLFQLTKRDIAIFFFLVLALLNLGIWILHLWTIAAGVTLIISAIATARAAKARADAIATSHAPDFGSQPEITSDLS
jgi:phosphatidylglycerophosphate synthase